MADEPMAGWRRMTTQGHVGPQGRLVDIVGSTRG